MKTAQKAFVILVIIALSIPMAPMQRVFSAPDPVVSPGVDSDAMLVGAVKYRAFTEGTPTTTTGVYLGIPNLNNKHYRSELDLQWTNQNAITFTYDVASDWLTAEVTNANGSWATIYNNFSANVTSRVFGGDTSTANNVLGGLNYLEIIIQLRKDQPTLLSLHDVHLIDEHSDDYSLGNFIGDKNADASEWMVTGHDISGGFVLTADLHSTNVIGPDDLNNIMISFGYQDLYGPVTSNVVTSANPVVVSTSMTVTATVDDTTTGGLPILSAEYSLDGGFTWGAMNAVDGLFDGVSEDVTVTRLAPSNTGTYDLCVRGTDSANNIGEMSCIYLYVLPVFDDQGPLAENVDIDSNPIVLSSVMTITATIDDSTTGGSPIQSSEFSMNGGATWSPMGADDGSYGDVTQDVIASSTSPDTPGNYQLCVRGTDMSGNTGEMECVTLFVTPAGDVTGPLSDQVIASPNPVAVDTSMNVTAAVDDTTTGGSQIAFAEFSLDGGSTWIDMQAVDGAFDEVAEDVTVSSTSPDTPGNYQLCVRGTDMSGNTGGMACVTLFVTPAGDVTGPLSDQVSASPNPVLESGALTVSASVDDMTTGGSQIASAEVSLDGGSTWADMQAVDGAFDEVTEDVTVSTTAPDMNGNYLLCIRGTDMSGNTGEMKCVTLAVHAEDNEGPLVSDLAALPNPVIIDHVFEVSALIDESTTGGADIAGAEYKFDTGPWVAMDAQDGDFNEVSEVAIASHNAPNTPGEYTLCVRGSDSFGNTGSAECITVTAYIPKLYLPIVVVATSASE